VPGAQFEVLGNTGSGVLGAQFQALSVALRRAAVISQDVKRNIQRLGMIKSDATSLITRFDMIHLTVNGENRQFAQPLTIRDLAERLELTGKRIALERNGEIVPRSQFDQVALADGDALEIVVAVGGG
jgi:sulfur carrier protein